MALKSALKATVSRVGEWLASNIRDFFVLGGLSMLGYGLHLEWPWLGYAVPGAILLSIGLFVGKRGKP